MSSHPEFLNGFRSLDAFAENLGRADEKFLDRVFGDL